MAFGVLGLHLGAWGHCPSQARMPISPVWEEDLTHTPGVRPRAASTAVHC